MSAARDSAAEVLELREKLAEALSRAERAENLLASRGSVHATRFLEVAAEEVQHSERLMRAVFTGASDGLILLDAAGRFVDVNPAACALLGANKAKLLRGRIHDFTASPEGILSAFAPAGEAGSARGRHVLTRTNGERRVVDFAATSHIGPDLNLLAMRDVTLEREAVESLARTEVELRRSDARFHAVMDKSAEAIALLSEEGRIDYVTQHTTEMLGTTPLALVGTRLVELAHPDDQRLVEETLERAVAEGSATTQFRVVHASGQLRWCEAIVTNFLRDGDIRAIITNIRDITRERSAEQERERLIESLSFERSRIGHVLERAPSFVAVLRGEKHIVELANRAYYALVGQRDLIGRPVAEALPELVRQGIVEVFDRVLGTGAEASAAETPLEVVHPDGTVETRFVNVLIQPFVESNGARTGVFVHGIDVTEETHVKRRAQALFNGIPVPTYAWRRLEKDGRLRFYLIDFNEAALRATGGKVAEMRGRAADEVEETGVSLLAHDLEQCLALGETFQRILVSPLSGVRREYLVTYAPAPQDMVLAHAEEVTEKRRLEEQLRQGQKMEAIGRLAGGVAHDFNNLLSVVLSYTSLMMGELAPTDEMYADLEQIQQAGQRAVELTRQLLAFSRQQVMQPRVMSVSDTVTGMETMLRRLLGEDVELELRCAGATNIKADRGQIEQVIMNLVINARDAMPEGGRLVVETGEEGLDAAPLSGGAEPRGYVTLTVTDSGIGMDDETRARIFEPFFTTKGAGKGTGLGLATVFGIVQQSGGTIQVKSAPGEGTSFKIRLPRAAPAAPDRAAATIQPAVRGGSETILVVEDEAPLRALVVTILRRAGYDVLEAHDGQAAVELASASDKRIDLLLTDVVMPRMNGRQVADKLSAVRGTMKTLFMSGYTDDAAVLQRVLASKAAFLQKPITPEVLLKKVRKVLDGGAPS
ncbi:MAG: hybrid sensor histidine kinase/response regulator [Labilithrix sp.]|nr:hybrid sensor histidine kinase/response regulator [Labilithrix sp.]